MSSLAFLIFLLVVALAWIIVSRGGAASGSRAGAMDHDGAESQRAHRPAFPVEPAPSPGARTAVEPPPTADQGFGSLRPAVREVLPPADVHRLAGLVAAFPELPVGTRQIMSALQDTATTPQTIARITASDPALAARILRVVNSSFYNLPNKISDLSRAIVLLGYTQVRNLVLQGGLGQTLVARDGQTRLDLTAFWYHSFCSATCAFHFARKLGTVSPGQASTLALLHDIGKPVFWWWQPEASADIVRAGCASTPDTIIGEEARFGVNHPTLGALLAVRWGLPLDMVRGIEYHHHPGFGDTDCVPADVHDLVTVLWMADRFAHRFAEFVGDEAHAQTVPPADSDPAAGHERAGAIFARWDAAALPALADPDLHRELLRARALIDAPETQPIPL